MLLRLFLLFTLVPLLDLALLVAVSKYLTLWGTVGLVLTTGILGAALAKHQGLRTLGRIEQNLSQGELPAAEMVEGLMILVAGVLLVTPGIITDAVGLLLLVPPIRATTRRVLRRFLRKRFIVTSASSDNPATPANTFIDVEVHEAHDAPLDDSPPMES